MDIVDTAESLHVEYTQVIGAIQFAGIVCETELDGFFISLYLEVKPICLNLVKLHLNLFGSFPIVALPGIRMLEWMSRFNALHNGTGINVLVEQTLKEVPDFKNPNLSHEELFNVVQFLTCIWTDIRIELYKYAFATNWSPLVCFENPVYYKQGDMEPWDNNCNILKAELLEIISSTFRFLQFSYGDYKRILGKEIFGKRRIRRTNDITVFPILNATKEDIYKYPGVACLNTTASQNLACNMLTIVRGLLARLCCMLLRIPANSIIVKPTTWETLADDLKQLYQIIQKMEGYINN